MSLLQTIESDYKDAFKGGDKITTGVLRILKTELYNVEIAKRGGDEEQGLNDEEALTVVKRQVKQLEEAKEMFAQGGRDDLVAQNEKELAILKKYLPQMMSEDAVREQVKKVIAGMGEVGPGDFGKVMGLAMKELKGKADGGVVGKVVKQEIGNAE